VVDEGLLRAQREGRVGGDARKGGDFARGDLRVVVDGLVQIRGEGYFGADDRGRAGDVPEAGLRRCR